MTIKVTTIKVWA